MKIFGLEVLFNDYIHLRPSGYEVGIAGAVVFGAGVFKGFCKGLLQPVSNSECTLFVIKFLLAP